MDIFKARQFKSDSAVFFAVNNYVENCEGMSHEMDIFYSPSNKIRFVIM
jgi:hypothetical protein